MTLTRDNIPHTGQIMWEKAQPSYPEIKPNKWYDLHDTEYGVLIYTHTGFLGLNSGELIISKGEITSDVLSQALYK